jgi:hypothetical protein
VECTPPPPQSQRKKRKGCKKIGEHLEWLDGKFTRTKAAEKQGRKNGQNYTLKCKGGGVQRRRKKGKEREGGKKKLWIKSALLGIQHHRRGT